MSLARVLAAFELSHVQSLMNRLNQKASGFKISMLYFQRMTFSDYFVHNGVAKTQDIRNAPDNVIMLPQSLRVILIWALS